jgi:hypothetical protein
VKQELTKDQDDQIPHCMVCGYRGQDPVREVIHGGDGPHAMLATALFQWLRQQRPSESPKILAFADSRQEALDYLPDGADLDTLTYDQWEAWGAAIHEDTGAQRLGFPAAEDGLIHRFFQGATYPSFTGALNTRFASDDAVPKWEWMQAAWEHAHPQSVTYAFMQEPLLGAEVWVTWDHVARLIEAFRTDPETFVAFASPRGPQGLGFMPVLAGLALPVTAPNPDRARELIEYLTRPETAATTLEQVGFFPPFEAELPPGLPAGIQAQADAVVAQSGDPEAVPSLLPIGLGEEAGGYSDGLRTTFDRVTLGLTDAFGIARETRRSVEYVVVEVTDGDVTGRGGASPVLGPRGQRGRRGARHAGTAATGTGPGAGLLRADRRAKPGAPPGHRPARLGQRRHVSVGARVTLFETKHGTHCSRLHAHRAEHDPRARIRRPHQGPRRAGSPARRRSTAANRCPAAVRTCGRSATSSRSSSAMSFER